MNKLFLILITATPLLAQSNVCPTSDDGKARNCIAIDECPPLKKLLEEFTGDEQDIVQTLREARCGWETNSNKPLVCCNSDLPPQEECGIVNSVSKHVIQGYQADYGAAPWMATLWYKEWGRDELELNCGGTLITARHVLTAGHCVGRKRYELVHVQLGTYNLSNPETGVDQPINIKVIRVKRHKNYFNKITKDPIHDIAILVLEKPVTFTWLIRPVCLPFPTRLKSGVLERANSAIVSGFGSVRVGITGLGSGKSEVLMQANLPFVGINECMKKYENKIDRVGRVCAGGGAQDSCQGDSGGPLTIYSNRRHYIVGIVSAGGECAKPGVPGIYTNVADYLDWINTNIITT